jgi:hypothetical protein
MGKEIAILVKNRKIKTKSNIHESNLFQEHFYEAGNQQPCIDAVNDINRL